MNEEERFIDNQGDQRPAAAGCLLGLEFGHEQIKVDD